MLSRFQIPFVIRCSDHGTGPESVATRAHPHSPEPGAPGPADLYSVSRTCDAEHKRPAAPPASMSEMVGAKGSVARAQQPVAPVERGRLIGVEPAHACRFARAELAEQHHGER